LGKEGTGPVTPEKFFRTCHNERSDITETEAREGAQGRKCTRTTIAEGSNEMLRRTPRDRDSTYEGLIGNRKEKEKSDEDKQKEVYLRIEIAQKKSERQLDGRHSSTYSSGSGRRPQFSEHVRRD
jgi:hypothetical protein